MGLVVVAELLDDVGHTAPATINPAAVRTRSICATAPRVKPVAARNLRSNERWLSSVGPLAVIP